MTVSTDSERFAVAVVGMAGRFPGAPSLDLYWKLLEGGKEGIRSFGREELLSRGVPLSTITDPGFVRAAAPIEGSDLFAASFFGYSPREARFMDPQQRIFLECAWEALEDAGYSSDERRTEVGVYASASLSSYMLFNLLSRETAEDTFAMMIGNDKDFLSSRVSYELDLKGPSVSVQTGCSSSLVAVHLAVRGLLTYQCDAAIAGGVSIGVPQRTGYCFQPGGILSPDGHCRTFDAEAAGTIFGEGAGVVLLKRLDDAVRDRDNIHALIIGSSVNNDGASKVGYTAPSVEGQAKAIAAAQAVAGISADTISYVESHGTATALGDPVEVAALTKAFRLSTARNGFCGLGSVKTNIGHLDAAAGVAGLLKSILMLKHRAFVPSLNFHSPNPRIDFASSPFFVVTQRCDWPGEKVRRAGVSSFGIGGTNAHVILEEAPIVPGDPERNPYQILTLSAQSQDALAQTTGELASFLQDASDDALADVAYSMQVGRKHFPHRLAVVCESRTGAIQTLETLDGAKSASGSLAGPGRRVAFLFPGGGTQYPGMAKGIYLSEPKFKSAMDSCCALLKKHIGHDLLELLYPAEEEALSAAAILGQPSVSLPAIFATEYSLATLLLHWGLDLRCMLGHSLGEYTAACLAGVFTLEDTLALVSLRGKLLSSLPEGLMISVSLSEDRLRRLLRPESSIAAVNSQEQCVVSGPACEIEDLCLELSASDTQYRKLHIGAAAHSSMVVPIVDRFGDFISGVRLSAPSIPFISNVTGTWITEEEARNPMYWVDHLRKTVRFADGLQAVLGEENLFLLEVGPSHTLTSLARAASKNQGLFIHSSLPHPNENVSDLQLLYRALGRMWAGGVNVRWAAVHHGQRRFLSLPTYPFERERYWVAPGPEKREKHRGGSVPSPNSDPGIYSIGWAEYPTASQIVAPKSDVSTIWIILPDDVGVAQALIALLDAKDRQVVVVGESSRHAAPLQSIYVVTDIDKPALANFASSLIVPDGCKIKVVYLRSFKMREVPFPLLFEDTLDEFMELVDVVQAVSAIEGQPPIETVVVTRHATQVSGSEESYPASGPLLAACRVVGQEYKNIKCRLLDFSCEVSPSAASVLQISAQIADELSQEGSTPVIAYRGSRRWREQYLPAAPAPRRLLRAGGTYLIFGGLGEVGRLVTGFISEHAPCTIVLVGRNDVPRREEWKGWLESHAHDEVTSQCIRLFHDVEVRGCQICVIATDISNREQMQLLFKQIDSRFGRLDGVFHLAGVTGAQALTLVADLDAAECRRQVEAKVAGTIILGEMLRNRTPDFCVLFSSTAALLGGAGLMAYSAANAFMDSFAVAYTQHYRQRWIAINWDGWIIDRSPQSSGARSSALDDYSSPASAMLERLHTLVTGGQGGQYAVCKGSLEERPATSHTPPRTARRFLTLMPVAAETSMERRVSVIWTEVLGFEEPVGMHDNFFELGGNSLLGLRIISRMQREMNVTLPVLALFEAPTVHSLAKLIEQRRNVPEDYSANRRRGEMRRKRRITVG